MGNMNKKEHKTDISQGKRRKKKMPGAEDAKNSLRLSYFAVGALQRAWVCVPF